MDIQDKIVKILTILHEAGHEISRKHLQDIFAGKESAQLAELELDQLESFGIGEDSDDDGDLIPNIIDKMLELSLVRQKSVKSGLISISVAGKRFRKNPTEVIMDEEEEFSEAGSGDVELDDDMLRVMRETAAARNAAVKSEHTRLQISLIQAIDRKIALDDFAESHNIDLDDVLSELNKLRAMGKSIDITYFTNEVIGADEVEEVRDSLPDGKFDMDAVTEEWGDVYNPQELQLLKLVLS